MRRRELPGGLPPPTKTELKRQARAIQDLADRLVSAPESLVAGLKLPDKLADSIALARRITSRAALLRQRQFVGKLMRGIDCGPIRIALESETQNARSDAARFKRAERWHDRLLAGGDAATAEFACEVPTADHAELLRLVGAALAERRDGRPAGAGRKLFRFVQETLAATQ